MAKFWAPTSHLPYETQQLSYCYSTSVVCVSVSLQQKQASTTTNNITRLLFDTFYDKDNNNSILV